MALTTTGTITLRSTKSASMAGGRTAAQLDRAQAQRERNRRQRNQRQHPEGVHVGQERRVQLQLLSDPEPFRLTSSTWSQSRSVISRKGTRGNTPALLINTSIGPSCSSVADTITCTCSIWPTSALTKMARRPHARTSSATLWAAALSSSQLIATSAPAAANSNAIARPIPCCAPVTRTALPASCMLRFLDSGSDRDFPSDFDDGVDGKPEIFGQMRRIALHKGEQCLHHSR